MAQASGNVRSRHKHENETQARINEEAHEERGQDGETDAARFHQATPETGVDEFCDLLRPFEEPIKIVERNEVESDGSDRRDRILNTWNVRQNEVVPVDTNQPVNKTDKSREEDIDRRNHEKRRGKFGVQRGGNELACDGGEAEEVTDPNLGQPRQGRGPFGAVGFGLWDIHELILSLP